MSNAREAVEKPLLLPAFSILFFIRKENFIDVPSRLNRGGIRREEKKFQQRCRARSPSNEPRHLILNTCSRTVSKKYSPSTLAGQVYDRRELSTELRDESSAYALHVIERETKGTVFDRFPDPFAV